MKECRSRFGGNIAQLTVRKGTTRFVSPPSSGVRQPQVRQTVKRVGQRPVGRIRQPQRRERRQAARRWFESQRDLAGDKKVSKAAQTACRDVTSNQSRATIAAYGIKWRTRRTNWCVARDTSARAKSSNKLQRREGVVLDE